MELLWLFFGGGWQALFLCSPSPSHFCAACSHPASCPPPPHPPDAASPTAPVGATHPAGFVVWRPVEEGRTPFRPVLSSLTSAWNVLEAASRGQ